MTLSTLARLALTVPAITVPALAATHCVTPGGGGGCSATISAAIASAAPADTITVASGTYKETVVITKPISLVGAAGAIIDATGLPQGVLINGLNTPLLAAVHVTGFTVENANLEGILVMNASDVTIAYNHILNNNKQLAGLALCPDLPAYDPGEAQDCGEGLHIQGVDHSILTANLVEQNSGGILISDDTGTTHDNLVSFNTVMNNTVACGITMASHVPSPLTGATVPFGVFHNTVYGNRSQHNGYVDHAGAGIGIFASIPGAKSYSNVVVDNLVSDNSLPGIAMHAHAPDQLLNDNMIVGNTVVNNGHDTEDAATSGPTGINIYSATPVTGNMVSGNSIQSETIDVAVKVPALVQVQFNALLGPGTGLENLGMVGAVDATSNWWSCTNGPTIPYTCSAVLGPNIDLTPWLEQPIPSQPSY